MAPSARAFLLAVTMLLAGLAPAVWALDNSYCSSFTGTGSCPPCRSPFDLCTPVDSYWESVDFCVLPDADPANAPCGAPVVQDFVLPSDRTQTSGQLIAFQYGDILYLTFKMYCPYALRPGLPNTDAPFTLGVYVWNSTELLGFPQYADGLTLSSAVYTCLTVVVDLRAVCDPNKSVYMSNTPSAAANKMCGCFPGSRPCPPADLSRADLVVLQPSLYTSPSPQSCRVTSGAGLTRYMLDTPDGSGFLQWDPVACGPVGTPRPDGSASAPPRSPTGSRSDELPNSPSAPTSPLPPSPFFPPPAPSKSPPPASRPPPRLVPESNSSPPPPTPASTPSPSPSPSPTATPGPAPVASPSPTPTPVPNPEASPSPDPTPEPVITPPPPSSAHIDDGSGVHGSPFPTEHPPPEPPSPPSPEPPAHHTNAAKSFFQGAGIGVLIGCGAVGFAILCCCGISIYVYCRRNRREGSSVDGDDFNGSVGGVLDDDKSLTNFSFAMVPHAYDKHGDRSSGGGGSGSGDGLTADMEVGGGSGGSGTGSHGALSSFSHVTGGDGPRVLLELANASGSGGGAAAAGGGGGRLRAGAVKGDARHLLAAHAAAAAAMGTTARSIAAKGGAAAAGALAAAAAQREVELQPAGGSGSRWGGALGRMFRGFGTGGSRDRSGSHIPPFPTGVPVSARQADAEQPQSPPPPPDLDPHHQHLHQHHHRDKVTRGRVPQLLPPPPLLPPAVSAEEVVDGLALLSAAASAGKDGAAGPLGGLLSGRSSLAAASSVGGGGGCGAAGANGGGLLGSRGSLGPAIAPATLQGRGSASPTAASASAGGAASGGGLQGRSSLRSAGSAGGALLSSAGSLGLMREGASAAAASGRLSVPAAAAAAAATAPSPSGHRPPPLVSIPSMGPLYLPESTFATHAPLDLDEDEDDSPADGAASGMALLPYGSAVAAPPALSRSGDAGSSSSSFGSAATLSSPTLRRAGGSGSTGGSRASFGGGLPPPPLAPAEPSSPFAGADLQQRVSASAPRAPPPASAAAAVEDDGAFSFTSVTSITSTSAAAPAGLDDGPLLAPAASFRRQLHGSAADLFPSNSVGGGSGGGGSTSASGPNSGGPRSAGSLFHLGAQPLDTPRAGGSPLRGAASVGASSPAASPLPPHPLPPAAKVSSSTLQAAIAAAVAASAGSPVRTSAAAAAASLPPPPPPHLQPLVGPHGSVLRPPQPAALQPKPGAAAAGGYGARSGSPHHLPAAAAAPPPLQSSGSVAGRPSSGGSGSGPSSGSPPCPVLSPTTSLLRTARSGPSPLPPPPPSQPPLLASAASLASTSSAAGSPSSSSRQPSLRTTSSVTTSAGGAGGGGGGGGSSLRSTSSLASVSSWNGGGAATLDLGSIRRLCADGDAGVAAAVGGCDGGGEEVPLKGAAAAAGGGGGGGGGGDGLVAVYSAVCQLEPGTLFMNKYKIRDSPLLGRHSVVLLAKNVYSKARVAIKFHADRRQYEREKAALQRLSNQHVPSLEEPLEGPQLAALGLPPALVMEAGRCTLTEWLQGGGGGGPGGGASPRSPHSPHSGSGFGAAASGSGSGTGAPRDLLSLKAALHQILSALVHLHSRRTVHRDVKPANIMWFEDSHRFKLIDLAEAATVGEPAPPCCTPLYSAPEQLRPALEGAACAAAVTPAADMWSFGVLAFEVLTGSRFYGPSPRLEEVLEAVFGHRPLPSEAEAGALAGVEQAQARRLIAHLVVRNPTQRWSAPTCHRNAFFASGDDTDQRAQKWDSMLSRISEVQQVMATTTAEVRTAQLAINFAICEPAPGGQPGSPSGGLDRAGSTASSMAGGSFARTGSTASSVAGSGSFRPPRLRHMDSSRLTRATAYRPVPMTEDDCIPGEPIYMLLLKKPYQIRITVAHARGLKLEIEHIEKLRITTPDNQYQELPVRLEKGLRDGTVEYVAEWDPTASGSRHLLLVTATEGPIQRRVVFLNAELKIHLSGLSQPMAVNAMLYVIMERHSLRYSMARFKLWSADRWSQAPQWVRDVAKGTMVLVRVAGNVVGV